MLDFRWQSGYKEEQFLNKRLRGGCKVFAWRVVKALALLGLAVSSVYAQKPDLHGTGANPSLIANHVTTTVTKDGAHLADATITADGACRLLSYKTSESLITMVFAGDRALDQDEYCNFHVTNRYGTASSWIVVQYTDDEQKQIDAQKVVADEKKAVEVQTRSGREWTVHLSNGETVRYTLRPGAGEPGVAVFADNTGREMKIMVANDSTVLFIPAEGGCYRTGKLVNGKVMNGVSGEACTPGGSWTAEMR